MTLITPRIQYYGVKLYKRFLHNAGLVKMLGEDACIDMYEYFVGRMNAFRKKHPQTKKVSDAFVKKCEKWITADLVRKRKRAKHKERFEQAMSESMTHSNHSAARERCTFMYTRLAEYFKRVVEQNPETARHVEVFLLYNSYFLTNKLIKLFAPILSIRKTDFAKKVCAVNKCTMKKTAGRIQKRFDAAHRWFCRMLNAGIKADTCSREQKMVWNKKRVLYKKRQEEELAAMNRIAPYPSFTDLAHVLGMTARQVRYSVLTCREGIRKYVSGW